MIMFVFLKRKFSLNPITGLLFLPLPITMDYFKREVYVSQFPNENKRYQEAKSRVQQIMKQKKK